MKLAGLHDDDRKPIRTVFGIAWLMVTTHGAVKFLSTVAGMVAGRTVGSPVNYDQMSLDLMLWFLLPLAIAVMFFRSHRNGMVILLALMAWQAVPVLIPAFQSARSGAHIELSPLAYPIFLVVFAVVSAWASAVSCGLRIVVTPREPLFQK